MALAAEHPSAGIHLDSAGQEENATTIAYSLPHPSIHGFLSPLSLVLPPSWKLSLG